MFHSKSSKLQQLFGDDLPPEEKEQSLKYKRPKATDLKPSAKNETTPIHSSHPTIPPLLAKVVVAYKQSELQGKVGMALIKNHLEDVSLILYRSKTQVLVTLQLEQNQMVLFKENKYWQFYDDQQIYWSFSFDSHKDEEDFREKLIAVGREFKEIESDEKNKVAEVTTTEPISESRTEETSKSIDLPQLPSETKETKNALIKRMAKMGQPLPKLSSNTLLPTTTEFSDSSDTEVIKIPLPAKPTIAPRNKITTLKTNHQLVNSTLTFNPAAMESQYMQMLLTEQRTQGSELRMNVSKLENKIEKVLDKLDLMDRSGAGDSKEKKHKDDEILELEEKILNLKKENRKLRQMAEQSKEQEETYEEKSRAILNEFKEELAELNMGNVKDLRTILKSCIDNIQEHEMNLKTIQRKLLESENRLKESYTKLEQEQSNHEKYLKDIKDKDVQIKSYEEQKLHIIADYDLKLETLRKELQEKLQQEQQQNSTDSIVKSIMNNLYADIYEKLEASRIEEGGQVLAIVSSSIKQQTLKSLQKQQQQKD